MNSSPSQNFPALVMKIMQANSALQPLDPSYSTALKDLIYLTLQRNPDDRPNVQKILATPIIVNAHLNLSTDVGRLPCSKLVLILEDAIINGDGV